MISIEKKSELLGAENTGSALVASKVVPKQNYIRYLSHMKDRRNQILLICVRNAWKK